ncbi:MAG: FAD-linked oxidase C-terminal domain-containing protein, partial [Gammaproteobacteria bacterium]
GTGVRLRLDANGAWATEECPGILDRLAPLDPEYVEEPVSGAALLEAHKVFMREYRDAGIPLTLGFAMSYHPRAFIMFQGINLTLDSEQNAKARALYARLIQVSAEHGWGIYRAHAAFMDELMATYSYNDHALMRLNETLKDALDPNGILAAGRYGIWPRHLRGSNA